MTVEEKEFDILKRFPAYSRMMESFKASRDLSIQKFDAGSTSLQFKEAVHEVYCQRYDQLLDLIIKLAPKAATP